MAGLLSLHGSQHQYIKQGYILKQLPTLLSLCLLFSAAAYAAEPGSSTTEATLPDSSPAKESGILSVPTPNEVPSQAVVAPAAPVADLEVNTLANYLLAPGDALEITVWKEEGLQQQQYLVSPDGTIIYPLIGTVLAAGKTITELKNTIASKLADYISDPSITVKLLNNQGNAVFVIGKVNKPGQFYSARKIDVLQALSLAGGLTVFADDNSISILRRNGNQVKVFPFDYSDVIKGYDLEQNILLEPGDTVTVP